MPTDNNKRLAKNSIFMTIRMVIVLLISLYTTRAILRILGVEDYGVYSVVCGFVYLFTFINTSMSNGIQRFFNYELGRNGINGATKVYNTSLLIQLITALVIIVVSETFGLWYLDNMMVVPDGRMVAAHWIFQLSILSFLFIILQVPYVAAVMAHEKFDFFAVVSILDAGCKLLIIFCLPLICGDQLIWYGILYLIISIIDFILYYAYTKRNFQEIKLVKLFDKRIFLSMLGFSGWNIFGTFSQMMKEQGINLVLNLFFGPVVNAARGVANQVNAGFQSFVQNITTPVRPQLTQAYAKGDLERTLDLTYSISKLSVLFLYLMSLPVLFEIDYVLRTWLGEEVPAYTNSFVIIIVMTSFLNNLNAAISNVVHATGIMKEYQLCSSVIVLSSVPLAYFCFSIGMGPEMGVWIVFITMFIAQIAALIILKKIIIYSIKDYVLQVVTPFILVVCCSVWIPYIIKVCMDEGMLRFVVSVIISVLTITILSYFIALNKAEKELLKALISKIGNKFK